MIYHHRSKNDENSHKVHQPENSTEINSFRNGTRPKKFDVKGAFTRRKTIRAHVTGFIIIRVTSACPRIHQRIARMTIRFLRIEHSTFNNSRIE
ncbi:hypothetical protein TcasGA2_TC013358 [Tribolium castaneum]|uniref:Uncharacterized protein n=1 Tax=Tribolium castaneum TaxID=7070 RepID=D6WM12_TRICA|nr:hypothetical protein TcasGA2_TC013358 [Tribolium castaneum]